MTSDSIGHRRAKRVKEDPKSLRVLQQRDETPAAALSHATLRPAVQAAVTLMQFNQNFGEMSVNTLVDDLEKHSELANNGDLARTEAMLVAQAYTLDAIFHALARKADCCEWLNQKEVNLRLALKAQSQCRATLEALVAIRNPQPVAFVRQANIAHGPQQVNNGVVPSDGTSRAQKIENPPNKLLEKPNGQRLDLGTTGSPGKGDSPLEAVDRLHGTKDGGRKSASVPQPS